MKNKPHTKKGTLFAIVLFLLLLSVSAAQGLVQFRSTTVSTRSAIHGFSPVLPPPTQPLNDPYFFWDDDFQTEEHIDPSLSHDYVLENGVIKIKNTYLIWIDPTWTRMKPITVVNNGGSLSGYAIPITVIYDSDMQLDYDDIRFKHEDYPTTWLDYWIESSDSVEAHVWVKIPVLPSGTSEMYLFYGNPYAMSESNFYNVFTNWGSQWANDYKISYHAYNEGAWDPDVAFGSDRFFVAWEEGTYISIKQEIRGTIFNSDGSVVPGAEDFEVFSAGGLQYRDENPSIAYGGGKFFVAWEHYGSVLDDDTKNIKGRFVTTSGGLPGDPINICWADHCQADPVVTFDTQNSRFCVVWEDGRDSNPPSSYLYDIRASLYDTNGNVVVDQKAITDNSNSQTEPWVAFNPETEQYLIVYEDAINPSQGPFSIKAQLCDENLNTIGSPVTIAVGTTNTDYNFPCVAYSEDTDSYLVTYNDGDISDEDWYGNVWGAILDNAGQLDVGPFQIQSGNYIRTDVVPYLESSFFVSYDNNAKIYGKLVASDGSSLSSEVQLSASSSAEADWANIALGNNKIFVTWEDERITTYTKPDAYGNMWWLNIAPSSQVGYSTGPEKHLILNAQVTSKDIEPENLENWHIFNVNFTGNIVFNILDGDGDVIMADVNDGEDISSTIDPDDYPLIKLQAIFSRTVPSSSPELDYWKVMWVGSDDDPPETTVDDILGDLGLNGWYTGNVKITLSATDGQQGSGVNHTYFKIGDGGVIEYDENNGIKLPQDATGDPNTLFGTWDVTYWSEDKAGNVETPQGPLTIKIDKAAPYSEIWDPPDRSNVPRSGGFWVQTTATDEGSGIHYVLFDVGPPYENPVLVYTADPAGSDNYKWWCDRSFDANQWHHIIATAFDYAGHSYEANIYVYFKKAVGVSGQTIVYPSIVIKNSQMITIGLQGLLRETTTQPLSR